MTQPTPIHDLVSRRGATFADEAGWQMPADFGDPAAEYGRARASAALFDLSHRGKVEVTGPDAAGFLHNLSTNDVKALSPGAACEAFLTTGQAKIVAHVLIERLPPPSAGETFWLDTAPGTAEAVLKHLNYYLITERVELADRTRDFAQFHLAGPDAAAVLGRVLGTPPADLPELHSRSATAGAAGEIRVRRHDELGLPGFDVICPRDRAAAVWEALTGAGVHPAGLRAYHALRVEAGTPLYGVDIDDTNLPQEVGRTERAVSFTKGCYIGQETVARIRTYGHVNRSLVGLKFADAVPVPAGAKVFRDGTEAGYVTSSAVSPRLGSAVALAYVRRGHEKPGTGVEVEAAGGRRAAEVAALPFARS